MKTEKELRALARKVRFEADRDDEAAHSAEDDLMRSALEMIRDGDFDSREIAKIGLSTSRIDFGRWRA